MKRILFSLALFCVLKANAQNYLISFTGSGDTTTVTTVKVENLIKGTSITLNGSDILRLTTATGINSVEGNQSSELKIYPNPMTDYSTIEFFPKVTGNVVITVLDMVGKPVGQIQSYLENCLQTFRLSGINNGFYYIKVKGNNYQFSGKLLSNGKSNGPIMIGKINAIAHSVDEKAEKTNGKGTQATIDMTYTTGDRLKFTGTSARYSTVITDIPVTDKTINFNFFACSDADNNSYPVVAIGTQVWMEENLKTTKFNDSTNIPVVTANAEWVALSTPGYCWYNNDAGTYKATYGALYNGYAVDTTRNGGKNICPTGWHVPADSEWTILTTSLGGESVAGGKLKETTTTHWQSPNTGATNESGFTARAGGIRYVTGTFDIVGIYGYWWCSTETSATETYYRNLLYNYNYISRSGNNKRSGSSVRCLRDN